MVLTPATVPRMNFLVLLVTVPVSIPLVLPSTPQPQSLPSMRKTILDSLGIPFVNPTWTTGDDLKQTVWRLVLSILAQMVMTLDFLRRIQHFLIETETETGRENVRENENGDVIVTEIVTYPVLNMVVAPTVAAMHQDHPQNNAIMNLDIILTCLPAAMIQKTIWM